MAEHFPDSEKVERVHRISLPTASFSLTKTQIAWIKEESERRGVAKSVVVREALDASREQEREAVPA